MKTLFKIALCLVALALAFYAGKFFQNLQNGYVYDIRESQSVHTPYGVVNWRYVTESVGLPLLDPGTTELEWNHRFLFKADRIFQEVVPFATVPVFQDGALKWEDGEYAYSLTIEMTEAYRRELEAYQQQAEQEGHAIEPPPLMK